MEKERSKLYGLLAKFDSPEALVAATSRAYEAGYRKIDAYAPFPVDGLSKALHMKPSLIPYFVLAGGLAGALGAFAMQSYALAIDYPLNIGGRPLFSWPTYIPITFETTILLAALAGVLGLFFFTRFPQPYHPVFRDEDFNEHGSKDGFYLDIEAKDPNFDLDRTRQFLHELGSIQVTELEA